VSDRTCHYLAFFCVFLIRLPPPPPSPLFPYTTLFRSVHAHPWSYDGAGERRRSCPVSVKLVAVENIGTIAVGVAKAGHERRRSPDRKSTRLNSSHRTISYAVFCLKKKKHKKNN